MPITVPPGVLESVQTITFQTTGSVYGWASRSDTTTITAVDTDYSVVHNLTDISGDDDGNLFADGVNCEMSLTNSTTARVDDRWYRNASATETFNFYAEVLEFKKSAIKSIQFIEMGFTPGNQTISSVDLDKTIIIKTGFAAGNQNQQYDCHMVDATTVYAEMCCAIVEFK